MQTLQLLTWILDLYIATLNKMGWLYFLIRFFGNITLDKHTKYLVKGENQRSLVRLAWILWKHVNKMFMGLKICLGI